MRTHLFIILFSLIITASCSNKPKKDVDNYPNNWRIPDNSEMISIGRTLVKNDISGCGEYYIRQGLNDPTEFLVACTRDGKEYNYYLVWGLTEKVMRVKLDGSISVPVRQ